MIDSNPSEDTLLSYYNVNTLTPRSSNDLKLLGQDHLDPEEIQQLSQDEQFNLLSDLISTESHSPLNEQGLSKSDVEDPLVGRGSNVYKKLIQDKIVKSSTDPELNQYLISSSNFNSKQFLTTFHSQTPIEELVSAVDFLEHNIQSQTSELKGVIDANFLKFINCKKSIDEVLIEFKNQRSKLQKERESSKVFNPKRHQQLTKSKMNSLSSILEDSINNLNTTSSLMIRPIMENKLKENKVHKLIEFIKSHQSFFDLPSKLCIYISNHSHDLFIEDYNSFLNEKELFLKYQKNKYNREMAKFEQQKDDKAIEALKQDQLLINTSLLKVFNEVDNIVDQYKKKIFKELLSLDYEVSEKPQYKDNNNTNSKFLSLIDKLYQLDIHNTQENPIYDFLMNQLNNIDEELEYQISKFDNKFGMMQKKLNDYIKSLPDSRRNGSHIKYIADKYNDIESYLATSSNDSPDTSGTDLVLIFQSSENLDLSIINETWLILNNFINYLNGLFIKNLKKFTNNYKHYKSSEIDVDGKIKEKFDGLVEKVNVILVTLFEDEEGNNNQLESSPSNYKQFLPNFTNSLSAMHYLGGINKRLNEFLTHLGDYASTIGNVSASSDTNKVIKNLRNCSLKINQKILEAICAVWVNDCSQFYDLESWEIRSNVSSSANIGADPDAFADGSFTKLMNIIECYQTYILLKLKLLITNKENYESDCRIVAAYPSKRILVSIEIQFMRSLNIIIDSIMKRYSIERNQEDNTEGTFKVLTMNNFDKLSRAIYPRLIKRFDRLFEKGLLSQNLKLFADIDKASLTIFDDILNKEKIWLTIKVNNYFNASRESKPKILKVDGFIYEILIHFVKLVHKVKPITGAEIFISIVNELQMHLIKNVLDNLRNANNLTAVDLVNLKLDVNFFMEVFEISNTLKFNDQTFKLLEILLNTIEEKFNGDGGYSKLKFKGILERNLQDSQSQFGCF
ncbi:uncharacterized protein CANTADRAFT_55811 [Suhomyces tanzawaensis NRRL Y-17324]|uniref:Exocyst complex component SEC5 n=1 Tax=Suhomyces tanzawaensis NRRL Y-17324 TaxID=984487 RepID=A0A1E4SDQ9_9ASCO|nr:uncharacterized protein CANTADRAFT_55811 [Suhomyces tanzawaensis NRRL Y-17324]ODV77650.1 hypothetical protein CANTADRAFT_55811 [Suhomyces tanzawaensis NRRL Y-17324]